MLLLPENERGIGAGCAQRLNECGSRADDNQTPGGGDERHKIV